jgi:hypothetical protein
LPVATVPVSGPVSQFDVEPASFSAGPTPSAGRRLRDFLFFVLGVLLGGGVVFLACFIFLKHRS